MDDAMTVDKRDRFKDIADNIQYLRFLQNLLLLHQFQQMPSNTAFHHQVDVLLVVEESVQFDNIGMVKVHLNFYLPDERFFNVLFFYPGF